MGIIFVNNKKIRLDVIPYLKSINPNFESAVGRTLNTLSEDEKYINDKAIETFNFAKNKTGYDIEKLKKLPNAIKNRVIAKIIKSFTDKSVEQKHINLISCVISGFSPAVTLPCGVDVVNKNGNLHIRNKTQKMNLKWEYKLRKLNFLTEVNTNIIIKVITFLVY